MASSSWRSLVGVRYCLLVWRTRFGFDLRATGANPFAAVASGVSSRRMIIIAMALSGAIAGLVGLPQVLSTTGSYGRTSPPGLGFTGIAVALLGRNNPVGIAVAALLLAFLDALQRPLQFADVPKEIVPIMQGIIVLSVVIAYEVIRRLAASRRRRRGDRRSGAPA